MKWLCFYMKKIKISWFLLLKQNIYDNSNTVQCNNVLFKSGRIKLLFIFCAQQFIGFYLILFRIINYMHKFPHFDRQFNQIFDYGIGSHTVSRKVHCHHYLWTRMFLIGKLDNKLQILCVSNCQDIQN